jgi:hypothetical protein
VGWGRLEPVAALVKSDPVATASSRIVESTARRVLPVSTPVSAITALTASKIRFGESEAAAYPKCW